MAQAREKGGRVVFIGNIPYGVSEEQICDIFGRVGTVVHFRLVYDKETHKPKGFGFLEYTNNDDAASAVRNLNDFDLMGRKIKVDYSNDSGGGGATTGNTGAVGGRVNGTDAAALPRLPEGAELPPGIVATDAISTTISSIPPPVLLDILSQMKNLVSNNPAQATALLTTAPQLSYAIFQALLLLGLVDPTVLGALLAQTPPAQPQQNASANYQQQQAYVQPPAAQYGAPPVAYAPQASYRATPPNANSAYQPPAPQPAAQVPNREETIRQVLAMSYADIMALDENNRNTILMLRQQLGAPPLT